MSVFERALAHARSVARHASLRAREGRRYPPRATAECCVQLDEFRNVCWSSYMKPKRIAKAFERRRRPGSGLGRSLAWSYRQDGKPDHALALGTRTLEIAGRQNDLEHRGSGLRRASWKRITSELCVSLAGGRASARRSREHCRADCGLTKHRRRSALPAVGLHAESTSSVCLSYAGQASARRWHAKSRQPGSPRARSTRSPSRTPIMVRRRLLPRLRRLTGRWRIRVSSGGSRSLHRDYWHQAPGFLSAVASSARWCDGRSLAESG